MALLLLLACLLPQATYDTLFGEAARLSDRGDYSGAANKYEAALALRPGAVEALSNLSLMYHLGGHYSEAAAVARQALRRQPDLLPANLVLGLALVKLDRAAEAVAPLERVLHRDPDHRDALLGLAAARVATGDLEAATALYRRQLANNARDADACYGLALCYERMAESVSHRLANMPGGAAFSKRFLGEYFVERGLDRLALEAFTEALALDPAQPGLDRWLTYAQARVENRPADPPADRLKSSPPNSPQAQFARARQLAGLSREAFLRFVDLAPDSWQAHLFLGDLNRQRRDFPAAIAQYEAAARLQPASAAAQLGLGTVYWELARHDQARHHLEAALALKPDDHQALFALGDIALKEHRYQDAARLLERCLRLDPGQPGTHAELGKAYLHLERYGEAAEQLQRGSSTDTYGDIHFQLARALDKIGRATEAASALRESKRIRQQQLQREQQLSGAR